MSLLRLIARLDIKGRNVTKGVQFEGLKIVGGAKEMALQYAGPEVPPENCADELLFIDTVASLYGRNQSEALLEQVSLEIFVPITVGGGIASVSDARRLFNAGADKIAVNTAALKRPDLINELADHFGSQAVVVSIEAKRVNGGWECYVDNGRQRTNVDVQQWAMGAVTRGAGELLITSVDRDGTRKGFDSHLIAAIAPNVPIPVTASGGCGSLEHLKDVLHTGKADAVAVASMLHYGKTSFAEMRAAVSEIRQKGGYGQVNQDCKGSLGSP